VLVGGDPGGQSAVRQARSDPEKKLPPGPPDVLFPMSQISDPS